MEVFAVANRHLPDHAAPYRLTLASQHGGDIVTHAGLRLAGTAALTALPERIDTLIVAGGDEAALHHAASEAGVLPWLRTQVAGTRRIASICTGAFVLAAGGWLDGRRATTHWNQCAMLQAFRPDARIEPDAIYVSDPPFHTSAGVTAGIDLCLALVEADCGAPTALAVARELVLFMHRPGGQAQFSVGRLAGQRDAARALLAEIADDPAGDLGVAALAARMHMSERSFARNFLKRPDDRPRSSCWPPASSARRRCWSRPTGRSNVSPSGRDSAASTRCSARSRSRSASPARLSRPLRLRHGTPQTE